MEKTFFNALYTLGAAGCIYLLAVLVAKACVNEKMMSERLRLWLYKKFAPAIAVLGFLGVFIPYSIVAILVIKAVALAFPLLTALSILLLISFWLGYAFSNT